MKKSLLSLSAIALGTLVVANTASAVAIFDNTAGANRVYATSRTNNTSLNNILTDAGAATGASTLTLHPAGSGHILLTPYFSAQDTSYTIFNIVNTDLYNGKAIKVRFRSASNSDDLLDFTLLLSPGDVWSGTVVREKAKDPSTDGDMDVIAIRFPDGDTTCTIPHSSSFPGEFKVGQPSVNGYTRLPTYLSLDTRVKLSAEGYIEVLNMADIPPRNAADNGDNPLYVAIKHDSSGVTPCSNPRNNAWASSGALGKLLTPNEVTSLAGTVTTPGSESWYLDNYGLAFPTGNLQGSWLVMNQSELASFSGTQTAMIATDQTTVLPNFTVRTRAAGIAFSPQLSEDAGGYTGDIDLRTADPLLVSGVAGSQASTSTFPAATNASGKLPLNAYDRQTGPNTGRSLVTPMWYDLPDLSTPILGQGNDYSAPTDQANGLTATLAKNNLENEWIATPASASVPFFTDWVVSQPTRRYHVALDYGSSAGAARLVYGAINPNLTTLYTGYNGVIIQSPQNGAYGPMACLTQGFAVANREEAVSGLLPDFSPGGPQPTCGEVFTLQFSQSSVLNAAVTANSVLRYVNQLPAGANDSGWARLTVTEVNAANNGIPLLGFAATQFNDTSNPSQRVVYNQTLTHRWSDVNSITRP